MNTSAPLMTSRTVPLFVVGIRVPRVPVFDPIHPFAASGIKSACLIATNNVPHTRRHDDLRTGDSSRAHSVNNHLNVAHILADNFQRIQKRREDNNCSAVLIVMKHRDVEFFLESVFNLKTSRRGDVLEVDTAKGCGDRFYSPDDFIRILCTQTDRKGIDARKFFEQHCLPFHHRHRGRGTNITQAEDRRSVSNNGNGVLLDCQRESFFRILVNCFADARHARRVSHREIGAIFQRHLGDNFDLAAEVHEERAVRDIDYFNAIDVSDCLYDLLAVFAGNCADGYVARDEIVGDADNVDRADIATRAADCAGYLA